MPAAMRRLRIAQVAPPVERVPPAAYGGTERVVDELTKQLVARGHEVTTFASGDSDVAGRLVPTVERALRPAGIESDAGGSFANTVKMVIEHAADFDVIHSHLEWWSIPLARLSPVPSVATFHGRLDLPWADRLLRDAPEGMVAISRHQASTHPNVPWTIIHNGLTLDRAPFMEEPGDAFCFVGRVDAEKGIIEAIDIALRAGRRLRIAAKVGNLPSQREYYESVFRPALKRAGPSVEYLGEVHPAERDQLFAESYATLMPGAWPEPFGLVSIESLACGTPVLARRVGALPEIIREGVDGFFGDDAVAMAFFADRLGGLDRREIRERVIERFSAARMTDRYEELYVRMIAAAGGLAGVRERAPDAAEVAQALAVQLPTEVTEPADAELPEERNGTAPPETALETVELAAAASPGSAEAAETVEAGERQEAREVALLLEADAVTQAAPVRQAVAASEAGLVERASEAAALERTTVERSEPEAEAARDESPVAVAVALAGERESDRDAGFGEEPEESDSGAPKEEAPRVEAAVVDVVVAEAPAVARPPIRVASAEPEVLEPEAAEPEPEPGPEPEEPIEPAPSSARGEPSRARGKPPVAVGPGPTSTETTETASRASTTAEAPAPASPAPPQAPPAPSTPPTPAAGATPAPAASKPTAKRPSRSISIFTRSWRGSSGKNAAGTRRHHRP